MTEEKVPTQADHDATQLAVTALMKEIGYDDYEWGSDIFGNFHFKTRAATKKVGYRSKYTGKVQIVLYNNHHPEKRWTPTLNKNGGLPTSTKNSIIETVKAFDEQTRGAREREAQRQANADLAKNVLEKTSWWPYWTAADYYDRRSVEELIGQPNLQPIIGPTRPHRMNETPKVDVSLSIPVDTPDGVTLISTISDLVLAYLKAQMAKKA